MDNSDQKIKLLYAKLDIIIYLLVFLLKKDHELDDKTVERLVKNLTKAAFTQNEVARILTIRTQEVSKLLKK